MVRTQVQRFRSLFPLALPHMITEDISVSPSPLQMPICTERGGYLVQRSCSSQGLDAIPEYLSVQLLLYMSHGLNVLNCLNNRGYLS